MSKKIELTYDQIIDLIAERTGEKRDSIELTEREFGCDDNVKFHYEILEDV